MGDTEACSLATISQGGQTREREGTTVRAVTVHPNANELAGKTFLGHQQGSILAGQVKFLTPFEVSRELGARLDAASSPVLLVFPIKLKGGARAKEVLAESDLQRFASVLERIMGSVVQEIIIKVHWSAVLVFLPSEDEASQKQLATAMLVAKLFGYCLSPEEVQVGTLVQWMGYELSIATDADGTRVLKTRIPSRFISELRERVQMIFTTGQAQCAMLRLVVSSLQVVACLVPLLRPCVGAL